MRLFEELPFCKLGRIENVYLFWGKGYLLDWTALCRFWCAVCLWPFADLYSLPPPLPPTLSHSRPSVDKLLKRCNKTKDAYVTSHLQTYLLEQVSESASALARAISRSNRRLKTLYGLTQRTEGTIPWKLARNASWDWCVTQWWLGCPYQCESQWLSKAISTYLTDCRHLEEMR